MKQMLKIAVFPGDGIGPEITEPTVAILQKLCDGAAGRFVQCFCRRAHFTVFEHGEGGHVAEDGCQV